MSASVWGRLAKLECEWVFEAGAEDDLEDEDTDVDQDHPVHGVLHRAELGNTEDNYDNVRHSRIDEINKDCKLTEIYWVELQDVNAFWDVSQQKVGIQVFFSFDSFWVTQYPLFNPFIQSN